MERKGIHKLTLTSLRAYGVDSHRLIALLEKIQGPLRERASNLIKYTRNNHENDNEFGFWISCEELDQIESDEGLDEKVRLAVKTLRDAISAITIAKEVDLHSELKAANADENVSFSSVIKIILHERETIGPAVLGMSLKLAFKDCTVTYDDIEALLDKAEEVQQSHLFFVLQIAKRKPLHNFFKIKKILKNMGTLDSRNYELAYELLQKDNSASNDDYEFLTSLEST